MSGFDNEVIYAENVDFSGASPVQARVTQDGELLIGSSVSPNIRVNTLSSSNATVTITNGQGTIDLVAAGSLPTTFNGNTGSATPAANILNIVGIEETNTIASGNTVSILSPRSSEFIVDPVSNVGTHTSITTAMASASSGDTIFVRPGTYTENFTLKAGVNLSAYTCDGENFNVTIVGKITCNQTGRSSISGIRLQTNSDYCLDITGANNTVVVVTNCYFNIANNTAIKYDCSGTCNLFIMYCQGTFGATNIAFFTASASGAMYISHSDIYFGSATTTASSVASSQVQSSFCKFNFPFSSSSTGVLIFKHCDVECNNQNSTGVTTAGTGSHSFINSSCLSGSASAISIGAGTTLTLLNSVITSTNTNAVTGAGTLIYTGINFGDTSNTINTTTQTSRVSHEGIYRATGQPAFNAYLGTTDADVTGDGTTFNLGDTDIGTALTERFDQNSNFTAGASGGAVFTAPITGKYQFNFFVLLQQLDGVLHTPELKILTTAENYTYGNFAVVPGGNFAMSMSVLTDMTAADTAKFALAASGGLKTVDVFGNATTPRTVVSGNLVC